MYYLGLLFEDIIIEEDAVVKALSRLPAAEVADRWQTYTLVSTWLLRRC